MALIIPPDVLRQLAAIPRRGRERLLEALELMAAEPATRFSFVTEMVGQPMWSWTAWAIEGMSIDERDQAIGRDAGNRDPDAG